MTQPQASAAPQNSAPSPALIAPSLVWLWVQRGCASLTCIGLLAAAAWTEQDLLYHQQSVVIARESVARMPPVAASQAKTLAREHRLLVTPAAFDEAAVKDAESFGLRGFAPATLREAQHSERHVTSPILLDTGQHRDFGPLRIEALNQQVSFQKGGAKLRANHMVLRINNRSRHAVAYYVQVRMEGRGYCPARGSLQINAIALQPGEAASLTVCAGSGRLDISDLRSMSISTLGYHYLSLLPPQTFGLDPITARAHGPSDRCSRVPAARLASAMTHGTLHWDDIADFYSRHSCERFQMPIDYRHGETPLEVLPFGASNAMKDALSKLPTTTD